MTPYRSHSRSLSRSPRSRSPIGRPRFSRSPPPLYSSGSGGNVPGGGGDRNGYYSSIRGGDGYRDRDRDIHFTSSSRGYGGRGRRYSSRSRSRSPYYSNHNGGDRERYGTSRHSNRSPPPPYSDYRRNRHRSPKHFHGTEADRANSTVLYLGNLPYHWCEPEVRRWLNQKCNDPQIISVSVPMEYRDKNRGFAFVDFGIRQEAEKVYQLQSEDSLEAEGRKIRADWDVSTPPRGELNRRY